METPIKITVCANCQKEPEFSAVNDAITKAEKDRPDLKFSHGICKRHMAETYKQLGKTDDWIKARLSQLPDEGSSPDFKARPELVRQYSMGVFTPEDYKKVQAVSPTDNLKEFFQKRAGLLP